jgi:hypothetical protein
MHIYKSVLIALVGAFALTACSVNVKKNDAGQDKNVDIKTPFGDLHVDKGADAKDTGLPVYAGARLKQGDDDDDKRANVNISTSAFGIKVVAVDYESDDAPSKLIAYYKDQLKRYGTVLECHSSGKNFNADYGHGRDSEQLKCEGDNTGKTVELKAGNRTNQHIVSIDPRDKGSEFALVYVKLRGKEGTI